MKTMIATAARPMLIGLGVILAIDLVVLGMFLRWAYVEHANVTESMLYGQLLYSSVDGSLMEIWGYLKELTIIGLALYAFLHAKELFYAAYALLFLVVLADDSLRLHEHFGAVLSQYAVIGPHGEILAQAILSGIPLALTLLGMVRLARDRIAPALMLLFGFCVTAFFAVVIDKLHEMLIGAAHFQTISTLVEDGGELISLTLILAIWGIFGRMIVPHVPGSMMPQDALEVA